MRKKLIVLIIVPVLTMALVACGNTENKTTQKTEASNMVVSKETSSTSKATEAPTSVSDSTEISNEEFEFYIIDYLTESEVVETVYSVSEEGRPCVTVTHADGTTQYHELYEEEGEILWNAVVRGENEGIWGGDYKIPNSAEPLETPAPTEPIAHEHNYTVTITKEANCTGAGIKLYSCSCGHSYEEEYKDFANHIGNEYVSANREPTCTEYGVINYVCDACSVVSRFEEIPATGHSPNNYWIYHHGTETYRRGCNNCQALVDETTVKPEGVEIRDFYPIPSDQIGNLP